MIAVLDASAALEVVLKADWVIAPALFISEVANAMWKYHKLAGLPAEICERCLDQAVALPDEFFSEKELYREAFAMSCTLNHPIYDAMYLVLARRNNGVLLSMDRRLIQLAKKISVRSIG